MDHCPIIVGMSSDLGDAKIACQHTCLLKARTLGRWRGAGSGGRVAAGKKRRQQRLAEDGDEAQHQQGKQAQTDHQGGAISSG